MFQLKVKAKLKAKKTHPRLHLGKYDFAAHAACTVSQAVLEEKRRAVTGGEHTELTGFCESLAV